MGKKADGKVLAQNKKLPMTILLRTPTKRVWFLQEQRSNRCVMAALT